MQVPTAIIASHHDYFLNFAQDDGDNGYVLRVTSADARSPETEIPDVGGFGRTIESGPADRSYEICWEWSLCSMVRNESYVIGDGKPRTSRLTVFSSSPFLESIKALTAEDLWPKHVQHWEFICLNHIIDVASWTPPTIRNVPR